MTRPAQIEAADPRGLIRESYVIDGITAEECRSVFLDWALGVSAEDDSLILVRRLLGFHGQIAPLHPMTEVLKNALDDAPPARRRGGARGRRDV